MRIMTILLLALAACTVKTNDDCIKVCDDDEVDCAEECAEGDAEDCAEECADGKNDCISACEESDD